MIKAKELIPKTIIEVTKPFIIVNGEPSKWLDDSFEKLMVNVGEQYEIINCKKYNGAFVVGIKQTTHPHKEGKTWI